MESHIAEKQISSAIKQHSLLLRYHRLYPLNQAVFTQITTFLGEINSYTTDDKVQLF